MNEKKYWLIPSNPKNFDAIKELQNGRVWWSKKLKNMTVNDIVYIYITKPIQKIAIKAVIVEIDDIKKLFTIELVKYLDYTKSDKFSYETLLSKGFVKGSIQSKTQIKNDDFLQYILDNEKKVKKSINGIMSENLIQDKKQENYIEFEQQRARDEYQHTVNKEKEKFLNEEIGRITTTKNYDKYRLNNEPTLLSKTKLAEKIIREYFKNNPSLKYTEIKKEFNFKASNNYTIILNELDYSRWKKQRKNDKTKRYSNPIKHNGQNYYITTQWDVETIDTLIKKAEEKFAYSIEIIKKDNMKSSIKLIEDDNEEVLDSILESKSQKKIFSKKIIEYTFLYKNILLKGVPGTGKSRTLENIINNHLNLNDHYDTNVLRINIHSASSNADLMQGIAINSNSDGQIEYKEKQGLILELIEQATFNPNQPFVLVLEEIQENSLNELIGDLIYLVEDSKRADKYVADNKEYAYSELVTEIMKQNTKIDSVELPSLISKQEKIKRMIIPHNLFIFCTSNYRDDRKVIEDNLLRRFDVIEIYPKSREEIGKDEDGDFIFRNEDTSDFLEELNKSIVSKCKDNGEIHPDRFMIGHSIWLKVEDKKAFSRAFLKVITEFKDVKDMHFDDFKKITDKLDFPFDLEKEYESYEEWIKVLQKESYTFLSDN